MALALGPGGSKVVVDLTFGATTLLDPASLDPTLLSGLPRVDNQYNEDYVAYVDHSHARNHGDFYVASPHEDCRTYGTSRYWFYRAWFHYRTIKWDNDDVAYFQSANGFFLDQGATQSLAIWQANLNEP